MSAFDMWLEKEFNVVKSLATAALPRTEFDKYIAEMEHTEISQKTEDRGDAHMGRGGYVGKRADSPRQAAKRRHGATSGASTPPTPTSPQHPAHSVPPETPPSSKTPCTAAFADAGLVVEENTHRSRATRSKSAFPRSLELWKEVPPTEHSQWSEHTRKLIPDDWNGARMERLKGVARNILGQKCALPFGS